MVTVSVPTPSTSHSSLSPATVAATPAANLSSDGVYAQPSLLYNALPEFIGDPLFAAFLSVCGTILTATLAVLILRPQVPSAATLRETPWWNWIGGPLGALIVLAGATLTARLGAALFIAMNDLVVEDRAVIPVVYRPVVVALSHKLRATLSGWDSTFWNLKDWYREA